jgi:hypothetical protein
MVVAATPRTDSRAQKSLGAIVRFCVIPPSARALASAEARIGSNDEQALLDALRGEDDGGVFEEVVLELGQIATWDDDPASALDDRRSSSRYTGLEANVAGGGTTGPELSVSEAWAKMVAEAEAVAPERPAAPAAPLSRRAAAAKLKRNAASRR